MEYFITKRCSYFYKKFGTLAFGRKYLGNCFANFFYKSRNNAANYCKKFLCSKQKFPKKKLPLHNCCLMELKFCQFLGDISFHYSFIHSFIHSISCFSSCGLDKFPAQIPADITGNLNVKKPC